MHIVGMRTGVRVTATLNSQAGSSVLALWRAVSSLVIYNCQAWKVQRGSVRTGKAKRGRTRRRHDLRLFGYDDISQLWPLCVLTPAGRKGKAIGRAAVR